MAKADGAIPTGAMSRQAISRSERGQAAPARPSVAARHERVADQRVVDQGKAGVGMAVKPSTKAEANETREEAADSPLMDSLAAAVKKMLARSKERGYVTYDELNAVLPPDQMSSEQIEDTLALLNEMGINVIESEEQEEAPAPAEAAAEDEEVEESRTGGNLDDADIGRTDDPVRMYLREMGSVELLSREGEIANAKRIEAGRDMMIGGICESPLTYRAMVEWRDRLAAGQMLLREIIDLDATYGGATPDATAAAGNGLDEAAEGAEEEIEEIEVAEEGEDEGGENNMSLAAMEQELLPCALLTFDAIAAAFKRLERLQEKPHAAIQGGEKYSPQSERRYERLKAEIVQLMASVRLNNGRIEQLVDQIYDLNRRLIGAEGKLMRLGQRAGVKREEFLARYTSHELNPRWLQNIARLSWRGWKNFSTRYRDEAKTIRGEVAEIAEAASLPIGDFK